MSVRSLGQYMGVVDRLLQRWTPKNEDWYPSLWFRGHSDSRWGLKPGWYRHRRAGSGRRDPYFTEQGLLSEFKTRAPSFLNSAGEPVPKTDWEWLFLMQHYGLPTRLLDWTESSLTGLYFALRERPGKVDSAVWVINPWWLNLCVFDEEIVPSPGNDRLRNYEVFREHDRPFATLPAALNPIRANPRIAAQGGVFTIHGTDREPFDRLSRLRRNRGPQMEKVTVSKDSALPLLEELGTAGISESTVFPELDALCREIQTNFFGR